MTRYFVIYILFHEWLIVNTIQSSFKHIGKYLFRLVSTGTREVCRVHDLDLLWNQGQGSTNRITSFSLLERLWIKKMTVKKSDRLRSRLCFKAKRAYRGWLLRPVLHDDILRFYHFLPVHFRYVMIPFCSAFSGPLPVVLSIRSSKQRFQQDSMNYLHFGLYMHHVYSPSHYYAFSQPFLFNSGNVWVYWILFCCKDFFSRRHPPSLKESRVITVSCGFVWSHFQASCSDPN